jgi:Toprim domain
MKSWRRIPDNGADMDLDHATLNKLPEGGRMAITYSDLADLCDRKHGMRDVACPFCGPDRRHQENQKRRVFRVYHPEPGFATYICARCGERGYAREDGRPSSRKTLRREFPPRTLSLDQDQVVRTEIAIRIWGDTDSLKGTLGAKYFTDRRGLHIGVLDLDHVLRWHARERMIVALMTDPSSGAACGIHRTFLNPDGSKRERKMLGPQGVIRLSPDVDVIAALGIVEGVEDGLAVILSGWSPVWCCTSAGGIERFHVLPGIGSLTIFADADERGMKAAQICIERWITASREARISREGWGNE